MSCQAYARGLHSPPSGLITPQLPSHRCCHFDHDQRPGGHLLQLSSLMRDRVTVGIKLQCNVRAMSPRNGPISCGFAARAQNRSPLPLATTAASSVTAATIQFSAHNSRNATSSGIFKPLQRCLPLAVAITFIGAFHDGTTLDSRCRSSAAHATSTKQQLLPYLPPSAMHESLNVSSVPLPSQWPNLPPLASLPANTSMAAMAQSILRSAVHLLLLLSATLVPFILSLSPSTNRMMQLSLDLSPSATAATCQVHCHLPQLTAQML